MPYTGDDLAAAASLSAGLVPPPVIRLEQLLAVSAFQDSFAAQFGGGSGAAGGSSNTSNITSGGNVTKSNTDTNNSTAAGGSSSGGVVAAPGELLGLMGLRRLGSSTRVQVCVC